MNIVQHDQFVNFLIGVKDVKVRAAIIRRVQNLGAGNPGDYASVGQGVFELRIHLGAGWRVYYGKVGNQIILLVGGGTKNGQQRDIDAAIERFKKYSQ